MLNFATQIAREAGKLLVQRLGVAKVTTKGDINLVTEADIAAENLIIERIRSYYPQHGILAEESGEAVLVGGKRSEWKWIIDPLDGTTNYAHSYPCFAVSIGLEHAGELEIGVVYDPMRDEMFAAERGQGATLNDRRIRVSSVEELNAAMVCTGFPYNVRERPDFAREFVKFTMEAQAVRRDGSAALDLAYVACGRFDGFWEDGLSPWDIAAGAVLIQEARGKITNFNDQPVDIYNEQVLATNGLVHDAMRKVINRR
ncbi:MAG TPA: inositol monophosphatase family protein [Pyrinomonadaceae bacterium]|nr:inositol monophosphatase family protein [Pyrinomonadaceae bacterium]